MTIRIKAGSREVQEILEAARDGDLPRLQTTAPNVLRSARCTSGCTVLHWAAGSNQLDVIRYLLELFVKKNSTTTTTSSDDDDSLSRLLLFSVNEPVATTKRAAGRTPLHYAARNGCLAAVKLLVETFHADPNPVTAKHKVTPFQLAVWKNHLDVCQYLVDDTACRQHAAVDPAQVNDFGCGAIHWIGIFADDSTTTTTMCSSETNINNNKSKDGDKSSADEEEQVGATGQDLIPLAHWLTTTTTSATSIIDVHARQRQGHSALHKAAWGGHLHLCRYWHDVHQLWDDTPDHAGNYAADLADMYVYNNSNNNNCSSSQRHAAVARYLRRYCSGQLRDSCAVLDIAVADYCTARDRQSNNTNNDIETSSCPMALLVRQAYLRAAKECHPDRQQQTQSSTEQEQEPKSSSSSFDTIHKAYRYLLAGGMGTQSNPAHSLALMIQVHDQHHHHQQQEQQNTDDNLITSIASSDNDSIIVHDNYNNKDNSDESMFAARLLAVLLEYGNKGVELSNLRKKWTQVWPDHGLDLYYNRARDGALADWLLQRQCRGRDRCSIQQQQQQQQDDNNVEDKRHPNDDYNNNGNGDRNSGNHYYYLEWSTSNSVRVFPSLGITRAHVNEFHKEQHRRQPKSG